MNTYSSVIVDHKPVLSSTTITVGVLEGEGVGKEVVGAALRCLDAVADCSGQTVDIRFGGLIGKSSERDSGKALSDTVIEFCEETFAVGAPIFAGAGGSRFVYDMRHQFGLYCKLSPLVPVPELIRASPLKAQFIKGVDIMIVRENLSGIYQGCWDQSVTSNGTIVANHSFKYHESEVRDIIRVGAEIAKMRKGHMIVIHKESGIPSISSLWRSCTESIADELGVESKMMDVDYAAYHLIGEGRNLDVVVAPNLAGDVLGDLGALYLGSRGMSFAGSFSKKGASVFQTNHGSAHDLAGTDKVNPLGQISALAMMLREALGRPDEALTVENAIRAVLSDGYRTLDIHEAGCTTIGTTEMSQRIVDQIYKSQSHVTNASVRAGSDRSSA